ncbi:MAG: DNA-directed RNA polymerase subunit alpha [Firmicutes bacterium ADurb.Bin419]|nr:MAG: DNA-directed RNA polymerase subunit alpha [Firmicutes bacterium ADurb.Bin419]
MDNLFREPINGRYIVNNLKREDPGDKHIYTGQMSVEIQGEYVAAFDVTVVFEYLEKLKLAHIRFIEDGETTEFLYDDVRKLLVKYEDLRLYRTERYRRYKPIYDDEYIYIISFIEALDAVSQKINTKSGYRRFFYAVDATNTDHTYPKIAWKVSHQIATKALLKLYNQDIGVSIENLNLSPRTYNCLKRAGIKNAGAILALPPDGLLKVRNLGRKGVEEIISKLNSLGIKIENCIT